MLEVTCKNDPKETCELLEELLTDEAKVWDRLKSDEEKLGMLRGLCNKLKKIFPYEGHEEDSRRRICELLNIFNSEPDFSSDFFDALKAELVRQAESFGIIEKDISKSIDSLRAYVRQRITNAIAEVTTYSDRSYKVNDAGEVLAVDVEAALRMFMNTNGVFLGKEKQIPFLNTFNIGFMKMYEHLDGVNIPTQEILGIIQYLKNIEGGVSNEDNLHREIIEQMGAASGKKSVWTYTARTGGLIALVEYDLALDAVENIVKSDSANSVKRQEAKKIIAKFLRKVGFFTSETP